MPDLKKGFATSGQKNKLIVFDLESFKVLKEVETGQNPDALIYLPSIQEIATSLEVKATIALDGKPEAAVDHAEKGLVYVNLEDKSAVAAVDVRKHELAGTHSIAPGDAPTGLAADFKNGLLFAGRGNKKLVVVDFNSWKVVGSVEIGDHCDGAAFDPGTGNAYASCRDKSGGLHVKDEATFEPLPALDTAGGKTCALDPKSHKLFITSGPARGQSGTPKILVFAP